MTQKIVDVKQLNASYGQEVVLKDLDFSIKKGEVIGIIGESGIGKSTFLECLLGNIHQKVMMNVTEMKFLEENWLILDRNKRREYLRQDIGIIFQNGQHSLDPLFTIGQQLEELMVQPNLTKIVETLKMVQLEEKVLQLYPHELSGGMLQRVMIAMAFINHPKLIIADEPFSALDAPLQVEMMQLIVDIANQNRTATILVTHQQELAYKFCTKVLTLEEGHFIEQEEALQERIPFVRDTGVDTEVFFQLKNVSNHYQSDDAILQSVTVDIPKYEVTGIMGHSGAGKTTLAKILSGFIPYEGSIEIEGKELRELFAQEKQSYYRRVQYLFQNSLLSFNPNQTIENSLEEPLRFMRKIKDKTERIQMIQELFTTLELEFDWLEKYPHQLSGGQCQRCAIARAILARPECLICDEITSSLDDANQEKVIKVLQKVQEETNMTIVLISHNQSLIESICSNVIVLTEGQLMENVDFRRLRT
ncbi:ATP-binding cassette domain-containing protein [uncultured Granulicatella sp.]|uniref:ABC transporter ATP-binding protein n=1 Tax=uncultured Granulicatella sp. TaxID=316089 RepID=UPI0028D748FF|nr:ATP-binding cassette domain-containing protein [uncultured Granulicatella sp.]